MAARAWFSTLKSPRMNPSRRFGYGTGQVKLVLLASPILTSTWDVLGLQLGSVVHRASNRRCWSKLCDNPHARKFHM